MFIASSVDGLTLFIQHIYLLTYLPINLFIHFIYLMIYEFTHPLTYLLHIYSFIYLLLSWLFYLFIDFFTCMILFNYGLDDIFIAHLIYLFCLLTLLFIEHLIYLFCFLSPLTHLFIVQWIYLLVSWFVYCLSYQRID